MKTTSCDSIAILNREVARRIMHYTRFVFLPQSLVVVSLFISWFAAQWQELILEPDNTLRDPSWAKVNFEVQLFRTVAIFTKGCVTKEGCAIFFQSRVMKL